MTGQEESCHRMMKDELTGSLESERKERVNRQRLEHKAVCRGMRWTEVWWAKVLRGDVRAVDARGDRWPCVERVCEVNVLDMKRPSERGISDKSDAHKRAWDRMDREGGSNMVEKRPQTQSCEERTSTCALVLHLSLVTSGGV
ncbi:hypothetical protein TRVL_07475 [Trypanosoma vivax]|nr:hypothetical protein TRVL_07475 [Trypanosoma vivax]